MNDKTARLRSLASTLLEPLRQAARRGGPRAAPPYSHDYTFTQDWFTHKIPHWDRLLRPLMGRPRLRYLEVGVFEGRSLLWVLEHVLSDPSASAVAVDIFQTDY